MSRTSRPDRVKPGRAPKAHTPKAFEAEHARTRSRFATPAVRWLVLAACVLSLIGWVGLIWLRAHNEKQQSTIAQRCRHAQMDGDWPRMEELARQWATWQPKKSEPWIYAAEAAKHMNNPVVEAEYLSRIGNDAPRTAFYELGRLQMEVLNQPRAAVQTCLRTLKLFPNDSESHVRLLFYYSMTCQSKAVISESRRAIEVGGDVLPTYGHLLSARWLTYKNGFEVNSLWLENEPDSELYYVAAIAHLISNRELLGMPQESNATEQEPTIPMEIFEAKVREGIERYPKNVELQAVALARLCQAGDVEAVAKALATASAETANDNRFWRYTGWFHSAKEQWSEAIKAYEHALSIDPFDWATQHELATALRLSDDFSAAAAMQQRATLGKDLSRSLSLAPRMDALSESIMLKMAEYFEVCGDKPTAERLRYRLSHPQPAL